ncbi:hypothetical protein GCM10010319_24460 [Streptomyces blastmyceticus]|uniref:Uncharacterized protein n=1 Tax=Streptomyces blastmyceticus TaxID=68180 RepID=A0ABN0WUD6_9ACTN
MHNAVARPTADRLFTGGQAASRIALSSGVRTQGGSPLFGSVVPSSHISCPEACQSPTAPRRRFLHGREALRSGQETVPAADRRLLLQLFLRARAGADSAA